MSWGTGSKLVNSAKATLQGLTKAPGGSQTMDAAAAPIFGAVVTDTTPTVGPGPEPFVGHFVRLDRVTDADIPVLWQALGPHEQVWTHWPDERYDEEGFAKMIRGISTEPLVTYTIRQQPAPSDGEAEVLGVIILLPENLESRVMEIGMIYGPSMQRTPGATEAVYMLACLTFDKLRNRRLQWKTDRKNVRSCRAAERYGFQSEGTLRQKAITKGRNRDEAWYSIIDSEWPACKAAFEEWLHEDNFDAQGVQKRGLVDVRKEVLATELEKGKEGGEGGKLSST